MQPRLGIHPSPIDGQAIPVGGRLQRFASEWETVTSDPWVLSVVRGGYRLEFTASPPPFWGIKATTVPREPAKRAALLQEVEALIRKNAVVAISGPRRVGHYSSFFLTPKKADPGMNQCKWRPIINLKPLNFFISPQPFRMETLAAILQVLGPGYWGVTLDLKDAYLHVPIHPSSRQWLRFAIQEQAFEFRVLPFGLTSSPRVFTRIVKTIAEFLRPKGFTLFIYLDDFLIVNRCHAVLQRDVRDICALLHRLGFVINWAKSNLVPSQQVQFLGSNLDLRSGIVRPTSQRVLDVVNCAALIYSRKLVEARLILRLLGLMASLVDNVPLCRLRMRLVQLHLAAYYRPWFHPLHHQIPVTGSLRKALGWWLCETHLLSGVAFPPPISNLTLTTDASKRGWGAHLLGHHVSGRWSMSQARHHINVLELWAVHLALRHLTSLVQGQFVTVQSDNMTVVQYLNKQGGTRSPLFVGS